MTGRSVKRLRRLSTEDDSSVGSDDWYGDKDTSKAPSASSRPRRAAAAPTSATIERTSPEETRQSIHLTVKAAPNKLREATSGAVTSRRGRNSFEGGGVVSGQRSSRNKKAIVEESSEEEEEEGDEDAEEEDEELSEEDEDADGDEDVEMEDAVPEPPPTKGRGAAKPSKPNISISRPVEPPAPSVEAKEMAMLDDGSDDEELSELEDSLDEEEGGEEELGEDDDDDDLDSDEETPMTGSRSATPDLSKLTRRQRGAFDNGELMALSNEAQKKKHLTAEEHQMRRAEMARRRKNLSEKRNEEEKMDTINRLLKKQAPKRRTKAQVEADAAMDEKMEDVDRANPVYVRYVQTTQGSEIAVPSEWIESPVGELLRGPKRPAAGKAPPFGGRMVMEVV
ncbi:PAPA-1-like conserved region-domain-containing protein [Phyllosticta capitalensis]